MGIAKCSFCSKEVSEVGKTYYEAWEKKKDDFGMGRKEKVFCQNCWPKQEKNYRNYPCDTEEVKRQISKQEIERKTSTGYTIYGGDYICYDPVKQEWLKEGEQTPTQPENKPPQKDPQKENKGWIIWVILAAAVLVILLLLLGLWLVRPAKKKKKKQRNHKKSQK